MAGKKSDYTSEKYLFKAKARFNAKYEISSTGCWIWTAAKFRPAAARYPDMYYGKFTFAERVGDYAHRVSHKLFKGPIPEGLTIDHLCRNTLCVNPDHLEAVTQKENTRRAPKHIVHGDSSGRGLNKGPIGADGRVTHCVNGHPYIDGSFYVATTSGGYSARQCKQCKHNSNKRSRAKKLPN